MSYRNWGGIDLVDIVDAPQITDIFLGKLYKRIKPSLAFHAETKEEFEEWKRKLKSKIKELLGNPRSLRL